MQNQPFWEHATNAFDAVAAAVLLWRLWSEGLAQQYRFLTLIIAAELVQLLILLPVTSDTTYFYLYYISSPIIWILYYGVVLELYRLIFEDYPGISSAGRKAVTWSMGLAMLISALATLPGFHIGSGPTQQLRIFFALERSVVLVLLVFLVLIQLFLFHYRLRLSRNRLIYATGYALYFGVTVGSDLILPQLLSSQLVVPFSVATGVGEALILLAGSILLTHKGEARATALETGDSSPERERLQQQLVDMNRMLSKVARGG